MNPKTSNDLFNKIRSQFSNIEIGDESGQPTADANKAVFFDFEFKEDADTYGRVSVSIADGESMKVFYNRNLVDKIDEDSKDEWYAFLKELKDFAVEHQLRFDVRDITKSNLTKQDYKNLADTNKTVNTDEMSEELERIAKLAGVNEGLTGSARRSYESLDKTKLIIRHTGSVDETVPGARSRQIQSLYIENEDGERFKYPMTHLAGARAMQRHVANGGRPHDEFGEHIVRTSEDIAKLNSFARYVSHKDQLNDNAGDIIEQTKLKLENLRTYVKNLSKQSHYDESMKNFKPSEELVLDDETANSYKDKFTLKNLDGRVEEALPLIHKIMSELENAPKAKFDQYGAMVSMPEPTDKMVDLNSKMKQTTLTDHLAKAANVDKTKVYFDDVDLVWGSKTVKQGALIDKEYTFADAVDELKSFADANPKAEGQVNELEPDAEPIDAPIEPPIDHGPIVQSFLTDPDSKIYLNKEMPDHVLKYKGEKHGKNTAFLNILSDIASRMLTKSGEEDRIANFASRVADAVAQEKEPFFKPTPDHMKNKKIAVQLAQKYMKDKVEIDPADYNPKKDIKGKPKSETETFEQWVEETVEPFMPESIKPYISMYKDEKDGKTIYDVLDKDGESKFRSKEYKMAQTYFKDNFDELRKGVKEVEVKQEDELDEYAKTDFESWLERNYNRGVKGLSAQQYSDMVRKYKMSKERQAQMQKAGILKKEGNEFAMAVQKAKAAGMKAGDKFKVGDKEYTLKDAIEAAGLDLNEFYSEEEIATEQEIERLKTLSIYQ